MKRIRTNAFVSVLTLMCGLIVACTKWGSRENSLLMQQAQQLLETMPDSALVLLDAVKTATFGDAESAEYFLLRIQAKDKAGKDIAADTAIFPACEYFIRQKDPEKAALACYYAGAVLQKQGEEAKAVENYLKAENFANYNADNHLLKGRIQSRIGDANYMLDLYEDALQRFEQAIEYYRIADHKKSEIGTMIEIGNCYLLTYRNDSAFAIYSRAEKLASGAKDTAMLLAVTQNMGVAYEVTGNYTMAADRFYTALAWANRKDSAQLLINLADIYLSAGRIKNAYMYGKQALATMDSTADNSVRIAAYRIMMQIEAHRGNAEAVIDYFSQYTDCFDEIIEKRKKESLLEVQKKYDFEKAQAEHAIERRNYVIVILSVIIVALGFILWSFSLRKGKIRQERTIARLLPELDALREAEEQLRKLKENEKNRKSSEKSKYDEQAKVFFKQYFRMIDRIARECKSVSPEKTAVEIEKLKRVLFGSSDYNFWAATEKLIPEGLLEKIKKICPELDNTELKVCCLTCLNADTETIAIALDLKDSSVYTANSRIRKKIGMGNQKDIRLFLEEKL